MFRLLDGWALDHLYLRKCEEYLPNQLLIFTYSMIGAFSNPEHAVPYSFCVDASSEIPR